MNIDHRIERLDELLSDVTRRRRALLRLSPRPAQADVAIAGWRSLEHIFRTALNSAEEQLGVNEAALKSDS
jgi:hypothetical protein